MSSTELNPLNIMPNYGAIMSDYLLEVEHLSKRFGETAAVEDLSLRVRPGEIYGLVGPDGAGKTTTMRLVVAALRPDRGQIRVAGVDMQRAPEQGRRWIGYLSQRFSLYEDLTVLENIRFFAEVRGLSAQEWRSRSLEILRFVDLERFQDRLAGQLSGGMKQKLGLAIALVTRPRLLLLDEPTTGVDPVTRQDFWQLLIQLVHAASEPVAILISTPYMDEASRCHRIGFMRAGRLIAEGTPSELRARLNGRMLEVRGSPLSDLRAWLQQVEGVEEVHSFGDRLHVRVRQGYAQAVLDRLQQHPSPSPSIRILSARPVTPVLEDAFMAFASNQPVESEP